MKTSIWVPCAALLGLVLASPATAGTNSWTLTGPEGGSTRSIAIHPSDSDRMVLSSSRGMYRSVDGGASWQLADSNAYYSLDDLAYDPSNSNRIAGIAHNLWLSNDGGQSWAPAQGPPTLSSLSKLAFGSDGSLYVAVLGGRLFKAPSALGNWSELPITWATNADIGTLATDPANAAIVYAGVDQVGFFRSLNGGADWEGPLTGGPQPASAARCYSISVDPANSSRVLIATSVGAYLSVNGGASWSLSSGTPIYWAGFDPTSPNHATAIAVYGTILRSIDGGASFPQVGAELRLPGLIDAAFDAHHPHHLWLATSNGPAQSLDDGDTFTYRNSGIRAGATWDFAAADDGVVYVAIHSGPAGIFRRGNSYSALDPAAMRAVTSGPFQVQTLATAPTNSQRIIAVTNGEQLVRSMDGGVTWTAPHPQFTGSGADTLTSLTIDPANPLIAYVSRPNSGLWKSIDGGTTWTQLVNSPRTAGQLSVDPASSSVLYLAGGDGSHDRIYKSVDGGANWTLKFDTGLSRYFLSFAFDPADTQTLYAVGGGILKSTNGGDTWSPIDSVYLNGGAVSALLIDPLIPTTMVAVGNALASGFVRSVDGGASWQLTAVDVPGRAPSLHGGVLDPLAPQRLILGTDGAGIAEYDIAPDLAVSLSGPVTAVPLHLPAEFSATVRNLGPHDSSASVLRLPLPGWTLPSLPAGCSQAGNIVECPLGVLRVNASMTFDFTLTAPAVAGGARVDASIEGHELDSASANDSARLDLEATEQADLSVAITGPDSPQDNHATVTLPIHVANAGPNASTNTVLTVELAPAGQSGALAAPTFTTSQGACTLAGTTLSCALGTIDNGEVAHVTVTATASAVGTTQVTATADGDGDDAGSDQAATHVLIVQPVANLAVEITDSTDPATVNVPWLYHVTVRNNGPDAGSASLAVVLAGASATSATSASGACTVSGSNVACTLPSLASGDSASIAVTATSAENGNASATATVTLSGTDPDSADNSAIATTAKIVPTPPAAPPRGGGGRFDWLAAALALILLARRSGVAAPSAGPRKVHH